MDSDYLLDKERAVARQRLSVLESLSDPATIDYLERLGVADGWHCLEIGAGLGSIAAWLCRRVGPIGRVVATDVDTHFLSDLDLANLEVVKHDAATNVFDQAAFDLVHARNVLIHIPQRQEVLRKMARAVKPGGWLLLEEPDAITDAPDPTVRDDLARLYRKVMTAIYAYLDGMGLEPQLGARLLGELRALGFESLGAQGRVHAFQGSRDGTPSPHMMAFPDLRQAVVAAGGISDAEFGEFLALPRNPAFAWREALTMAAWGRRP